MFQRQVLEYKPYTLVTQMNLSTWHKWVKLRYGKDVLGHKIWRPEGCTVQICTDIKVLFFNQWRKCLDGS